MKTIILTMDEWDENSPQIWIQSKDGQLTVGVSDGQQVRESCTLDQKEITAIIKMLALEL